MIDMYLYVNPLNHANFLTFTNLLYIIWRKSAIIKKDIIN